jgi:plastocyanin
MTDACDPATFNAAVGEGTCVRSGGVQFADFLAQLAAHHFVGAWHFAPPDTTARVGQTLVAVNRGGEVHTFTEVEEFGGGLVPDLNKLAGVPTVAPECAALDDDDFVAPGATYRDEPIEHAGNEKYQCCIHPWMRLEVKVNGK